MLFWKGKRSKEEEEEREKPAEPTMDELIEEGYQPCAICKP